MPTTRFHTTAVADLPAPTPSVSDAELAFFERPETHAWWDAKPDNGQKLEKFSYWEDRKRGFRLGPANPLKPLSLASGGPDGNPIVQGQPTGLPPDILVSLAGQAVAPPGDLCIWAVAKAGANTAAPLFSLAGNNGGGFTVHLRSGNLVLFRTGVDELVFQTRISQTLSSADFALVQCNIDDVANEVSLSANGVLLSGSIPPSGIYSYSPTFPTARLSWFGEYDVADGVSANPARSLAIAMCGVATTHAPGNAAWQAALKAMVVERFPSLTIA